MQLEKPALVLGSQLVHYPRNKLRSCWTVEANEMSWTGFEESLRCNMPNLRNPP